MTRPIRNTRRPSSPLAFARATALLLAAIGGVVAPVPHAADAQIVCRSARDLTVTAGPGCSAVTFSWTGVRLGNLWRVYRNDVSSLTGAILLGTFENPPVIDPTGDEGKTYYYWVQDVGGVCGTSSPVIGPASGMTARPAAPTGVSAADGASCDTVHVEWNAVAGAVSYDVARGTTTSSANSSVIGNTTHTFFADTTADDRVKYHYWVRARGPSTCVGAYQTSVEPGSLVAPQLPDLVIHPVDGLIYSIQQAPNGPRFLVTPGRINNVGTGPLHLFPFFQYPDGTKDFHQRIVECGRIVDRYIGRYGPQAPAGVVTVPHFLRYRVRERLENGNAGRTYAQLDLPAHCLRDFAHYDPALAGSPAIAQFIGCTNLSRGISVGWTGELGGSIDLKCVPNGLLYLEQTVDPDNWVHEMDETNNVLLREVTVSNQPPMTTPPCTRPAIVARMLRPDSLIVAAGAPTDSIVATVWADGITEPQDVLPVLEFAQIGYMPISGDPARSSATHQWIWTPATFFRQDGAEDVFGGALVIPEPGEYHVAFRFQDADGIEVLCDRDGTQNGFSLDKTCKVRVQATTGVGDEPAIARLTFDVLVNPARGTTRFTLALPVATTAQIAIYDVVGRRVRSIDAGTLAAGPHVLEWDGRRGDGAQAPAGIYLARLQTGTGAPLRVKWVLAP